MGHCRSIWLCSSVQKPYQGIKKGKQVAFSTKCGLGKNVVLRLMESCMSYHYMWVIIYAWITISHFFVCLPTLELTTFEQQVCSTKIGYENALSLGTNSCKKRNVATLNCAHQGKKQCNFESGWLERQQGGLNRFF